MSNTTKNCCHNGLSHFFVFELFPKFCNWNRFRTDIKTSIGLSNFVTGALLNAKNGAVLGPLKTSRGYTIIFVKEVTDIDAEDYEIRKDILKDNLVINKQNQVFENWLIQLKDEAELEDVRKFHF